MGRVTVMVFLVGCASTHPPSGACPGDAPALEDCALGVYHADCGGDAEPVFACDEVTGACRWFTGGCVATGHVVSDCPIEDRCCHASADGPWAFADGWFPDPRMSASMARSRLLLDIASIGSATVDDTAPFGLEVVLDPSVRAPEFVEVVCAGDVGALSSGCFSPVHQVWEPFLRAHDTFALEVTPSGAGTTLLIEVVRTPPSGVVGRVFAGYQTDWEGPTLGPVCMDQRGLGPARGTLRIDRLEAGAHGELVVQAVEGGTVTVRF